MKEKKRKKEFFGSAYLTIDYIVDIGGEQLIGGLEGRNAHALLRPSFGRMRNVDKRGSF